MKLSIIADKETPPPAQNKPSVVIAANLKRERILLDSNGNEIRSIKDKTIINKAEQN